MANLLQFLLIAIGGGLGAMCRFGIAELSKKLHGGGFPLGGDQFPLGTLVANLLGCLLIGVVLGSGAGERWDWLRLGVGVGFLGALTTFSTFSAETMRHIDEGQWGVAVTNIGLNLFLGLALVALGISLGKRWFLVAAAG